jgi:hypothetical protein
MNKKEFAAKLPRRCGAERALPAGKSLLLKAGAAGAFKSFL